MVAWLIRASVELFGHTPLAVRAPFALLAGLLPLQVAALSPPRAARLAGMLTLSAPMFGLMAVFASPDLPLICATLAALQLDPHGRGPAPLRSLGVGALWGLALLSKLPAVLLGLALVPRAARRGRIDLAALLLAAALVWSPVLAFNLNHGLVMFRFHLLQRHVQPLGAVGGLLAFLGGVCALGLGLPLGLRAGRGQRGRGWALGVVWITLFSLSALRTRALPHWGAPGLALLAPAAALRLRGRPGLASTLVLSGLGLCVLVWVQAGFGLLPLPPALDPTRELQGWRAMGAALEHERAALGPSALILSPRYQLSSQVAWALGADAPVDRIGGRPDQFDLWAEPTARQGRDAVVFCAEHLPCAGPPGAWAGGCVERPAILHRDEAGQTMRALRVWWCRGLVGPD